MFCNNISLFILETTFWAPLGTIYFNARENKKYVLNNLISTKRKYKIICSLSVSMSTIKYPTPVILQSVFLVWFWVNRSFSNLVNSFRLFKTKGFVTLWSMKWMYYSTERLGENREGNKFESNLNLIRLRLG